MTKYQFITFEGIEGCGKSTQSRLLLEHFRQNNLLAVLTREPGGSVFAEEIRNVLVNGEINKADGLSEALLNFAARRDHINKLIKPAIKQNKIVICDRFFDSTYAYQGFGYDLKPKIIDEIRKIAIGDFAPDITFLIDIDVDLMVKRIKGRENNNRYEKMDLAFHEKVRNGFLKRAKDDTARIKIIDGSGDVAAINQKIVDILNNDGLRS